MVHDAVFWYLLQEVKTGGSISKLKNSSIDCTPGIYIYIKVNQKYPENPISLWNQ